MKPEKKFLLKFKKHCHKLGLFEIINIEVYNQSGIPDCIIFTPKGFKMLELKHVKAGKKRPSFSAHQILWATLRGSKDNVKHHNFILIEYETKQADAVGSRASKLNEFKLFDSNQIELLTTAPEKAVPLAVNDWEQIKKIISA
jgi:hypothetical protein